MIVPGLGGFVAHYVTASYDETEGLFLPPLRTLGFNPQLSMNDSLLVQSYIEAYDISYPDALRRIESEIEELRQHLESDGCYELSDIGVLRLNDEGNLEFEPCEAGILTPVLYGLSSFEMRALASSSTGKQSVTHDASSKDSGRTPFKPLSSEAVGESEETPHEPESVSLTDQAIVIKMSWLRNIAAVAAAVLAFFMIQTPVSNSQMLNEVQQSSVVSVKSGSSAKGHDVALAMKDEDAEPDGADARKDELTADVGEEAAGQPAEEAEAASQPTRYCIVLASQTTLRNARNFVESLKDAGYDEARVMEMQQYKWVRVVYGTYESQEEAYRHLRQLRKLDEFKDAWVMQP